MSNNFSTLILDLSTATPAQGYEYNIPGHIFQVVDASNASSKIYCRINDRDSDWIELQEGMGWRHNAYKKLWLRWGAQPGQWVNVSFGGQPKEARPELLQLLSKATQSSVTVDNSSPIAVARSIAEFKASTEPNVWALYLETQSLTRQPLAQLNPAALGGATVPTGMELVVTSLTCGALDTGGGLLNVLDGSGKTIAMAPVPYPSQQVDWQGLIVPAGGQFYLRRFPKPGGDLAFTVSAGVAGFLRGEGSGPVVVTPPPATETPPVVDSGEQPDGGEETGTGGKLPDKGGTVPIRGRTTLNPSADSLMIYVSNAGSDANDGLTPANAVATLEHAYSLVRAGYADWVLLKRGDTFTLPDGSDGNFRWMNKDGRSATERIVYTAYGDAADPRPVILTMGRCFLRNSYASNTAFTDLDILANNRDEDHDDYDTFAHSVDVGAWIKRANDVLFENCRFQYFTTGIVMQDTGNDDPATIYNVVVNRCEFVKSYSEGSGDAHGIFGASVGKTDITGCIFDTVGWLGEGSRPSRNHAIYFEGSNDITVDGNLFHKTSYEDVKFRNEDGADLSTGLVVTNNAFVLSQYAMGFDSNNGDGLGKPIVYDDVLVEGNVFVRTTGENDGAGGPTMRVGWMSNGEFAANVFTDPSPGNAAPQAIEIKINTPLDDVSFVGNVSLLGYANPFYQFAGGGGDNSGVTMDGNLSYNTSPLLEDLIGGNENTFAAWMRAEADPVGELLRYYRL